jgi:hypothetical protein
MNRRTPKLPKFKSETEEADWWASRAGREYVKRKSARGSIRRKEGPGVESGREDESEKSAGITRCESSAFKQRLSRSPALP